MSRYPRVGSPDRFTSAFLAGCQESGPNVWAEAGKAIETAHRMRLPLDGAPWSVLISIVIISFCAS